VLAARSERNELFLASAGASLGEVWYGVETAESSGMAEDTMGVEDDERREEGIEMRMRGMYRARWLYQRCTLR